MGDMREDFDALREHKRERKGMREAQSMRRLHTAQIAYKRLGPEHSVHLRLSPFDDQKATIDFWPTTGAWRITRDKQTYYGVDRLFAYIKQERAK